MTAPAGRRVSVVIITFRSDAFIERCLAHLAAQTLPPTEIVIVDNASGDTELLTRLSTETGLPIRVVPLLFNVGYAGGCNAAEAYRDAAADYVLYVGPDTYLTPEYIEQGVAFLEGEDARQIGALSGLLLGYSNERDEPTGLVDSAGIEQTWYGRWYDRGQRERAKTAYAAGEPAALCGTALLCRGAALESLRQGRVGAVYDGSFFMYKEDIDLSLRLREGGYRLHFLPSAIAYHCRGWDRAKMSRRAKILSARNETTINARRGTIPFLYSCAKLFVVSHGLL